ncbi:MAG: YIP1 family protein, partial [Planctomycetota bacterium]
MNINLEPEPEETAFLDPSGTMPETILQAPLETDGLSEEKILSRKELLTAQMKTEGKKFFVLLRGLMADPQQEIHSMYEKKPYPFFGAVILLNILLLAFYASWSSETGLFIDNFLRESMTGVLGIFLVFGALYTYLRIRNPQTQWGDALTVVGISQFPLFPCIVLANVFEVLSFHKLHKVADILSRTGTGFTFLFAFLCFLEIFKLPVKLSIYTIPAIFVISEFISRA